MIDADTLIVFSGACLLLLVVPGPAVLYIMARGVEQGRIAAMIAVAGIHLGTVFHIAAAGLGLSAILTSSALAFTIVKYLGALYLIYLGVRTLLGREQTRPAAEPQNKRWRRIFVESAVVNILNPKTALFFFAFLPQFVDPAAGVVGQQIVVLGSIFIVIGFVSDGLYALGAGSFSGFFRGSPASRVAGKYVTGAIFIGLGLVAALAEPRHD